MIEYSECISCRRLKANLQCEICEESICKNCSQNLATETFSFLEKIPDNLNHALYCSVCYDREVLPALLEYNETLERAKGVFVFFTTQRKEIPLIRRSKIKVQVTGRPDRDETIYRLGFLAAKEGYNAITEVNVFAEKVRNAGYQTSTWQGSGIPAQVDAEKMDRQDQLNQIYR